MRILVTGFVAFVVWCVVSAWLYNDKLLPLMRTPEPVKAAPVQSAVADSIARINAAMPKMLSVYFEFNKFKFNGDQQTDNGLAAFREWLDKYPASMLLVTGHTDLVGTQEYNQKLGMKRAEEVQKYLLSKGFNTGRMVVSSKGETEPAADYLTSEGRAKNRRTEISIKMN